MRAVRRGLTLLEVVFAATLLAVIAASCVPMLQAGVRWADRANRTDRFDDLAAFADDVLSDPERFGLTIDELVEPGFEAAVPTSDTELGDVRVTLLSSDDEGIPHGWLVFESEGDAVLRFVSTPEESEP